jgi:hypothetical protein
VVAADLPVTAGALDTADTMWRRFKQPGVAQLGDGPVGLPAGARTREQLDWVAEQIVEYGGTAGIWLSHPATTRQELDLATGMAQARVAGYRTVVESVTAAHSEAPDIERRVLRRLRTQWRAIDRRDFFPPPDREQARQALSGLASSIGTSEHRIGDVAAL